MKKCEICQRSGEDPYFEFHHFYPGKQRRKKNEVGNEGITVCTSCGDQIHKMFTNNELRTELNDLLSLRLAMHEYILWVKKRPVEDKVNMKGKKRRL